MKQGADLHLDVHQVFIFNFSTRLFKTVERETLRKFLVNVLYLGILYNKKADTSLVSATY